MPVAKANPVPKCDLRQLHGEIAKDHLVEASSNRGR